MKLTVVVYTQVVYFGEFKWSLKLRPHEHKCSDRNCDCEKNETAKQCCKTDQNYSWDQKKVVDRESRLTPRKVKEAIYSLKNPNHINKMSYMLPEIGLPNLRQLTVCCYHVMYVFQSESILYSCLLM